MQFVINDTAIKSNDITIRTLITSFFFLGSKNIIKKNSYKDKKNKWYFKEVYGVWDMVEIQIVFFLLVLIVN